MICISIGNKSALEQLNRLQPELVEIRFDLLDESPEKILSSIRPSTRVIATCRPGKMDDQERFHVLEYSVLQGVEYVDIEFEADSAYREKILKLAASSNTDVIVSFHDFQGTPAIAELESILSACYAKGGNVAKIACQVNDLSDNARLLSLYTHSGRKVVLGMGEKGKITRLAAPELGAEFTFVSMDEGNATAPGQLTLDDYLYIFKKLHNT